MTKFVKSRELREAEKAESISVQSLTFQSADDKRAGKSLTHSSRLCPIEVAAAAGRNRAQPFQFSVEGLHQFFSGNTTAVMDATQNYQGAHLENARQSANLIPSAHCFLDTPF